MLRNHAIPSLAAILLVGCGSGNSDKRPDDTSAASTGDTPTAAGTGATSTGTGATGTGTGATGTGTGASSSPLVFTSGKAPKNLLMISIDTFRADAVDKMGGTGVMPFLSSIADQSHVVVDTRACAHWTFPTTACAIGGRSSVDLTVQTGVLPQSSWPGPAGVYPPGTPFLPTWLKARGFYSMHFSANQAFSDGRGQTDDYDEQWVEHEIDGNQLFDKVLLDFQAAKTRGAITDDDPWYVHVHMYDPHRVYDPPPSYLGEVNALDPIPYDLGSVQGHAEAVEALFDGILPPDKDALLRQHLTLRYQADLAYTDDILQDAWANLDVAGMLDDTLVVFWSDHGEQMFENGLIGHGKSLFDGENRVMFMFWARDLEPGVTTQPALATDIVPSLMEIWGMSIPPEITGLPLSQLPETRTRLALGISSTGPVASAHRPPWLIHWGLSGPGGHTSPYSEYMRGRYAFDLRVDPAATNPIWPDDPDLQALWAELEAEVKRAEPQLEAMGFEVLWPED